MKKKLVLLLLSPLLLMSCSKNAVSFETLKAHIDNISDTHEHPYYRVNGSLDFNGIVTEITDEDGLERPTFNPSRNGGEIYDLAGRKVHGARSKGPYIQNGKKILIQQ